MWSHYGVDQNSVVFGIDMKKANLMDENSCVIPAQYGEIVYTSTIPQNMLPTSSTESLMSIGTVHKFIQPPTPRSNQAFKASTLPHFEK